VHGAQVRALLPGCLAGALGVEDVERVGVVAVQDVRRPRARARRRAPSCQPCCGRSAAARPCRPRRPHQRRPRRWRLRRGRRPQRTRCRTPGPARRPAAARRVLSPIFRRMAVTNALPRKSVCSHAFPKAFAAGHAAWPNPAAIFGAAHFDGVLQPAVEVRVLQSLLEVVRERAEVHLGVVTDHGQLLTEARSLRPTSCVRSSLKVLQAGAALSARWISDLSTWSIAGCRPRPNVSSSWWMVACSFAPGVATAAALPPNSLVSSRRMIRCAPSRSPDACSGLGLIDLALREHARSAAGGSCRAPGR
jgi:hypothetical protein